MITHQDESWSKLETLKTFAPMGQLILKRKGDPKVPASWKYHVAHDAVADGETKHERCDWVVLSVDAAAARVADGWAVALELLHPMLLVADCDMTDDDGVTNFSNLQLELDIQIPTTCHNLVSGGKHSYMFVHPSFQNELTKLKNGLRRRNIEWFRAGNNVSLVIPPTLGRWLAFHSIRGWPLEHIPKLRKRETERLFAYFDKVGGIIKERPPRPARTTYAKGAASESDCRDALGYINASALNRDEWVQVGMSLHDALGDHGIDIWLDWSATDPDRYNERDCRTVWKSFKSGGGTGAGTLFHMAKQGGYKKARIRGQEG